MLTPSSSLCSLVESVNSNTCNASKNNIVVSASKCHMHNKCFLINLDWIMGNVIGHSTLWE